MSVRPAVSGTHFRCDAPNIHRGFGRSGHETKAAVRKGRRANRRSRRSGVAAFAVPSLEATVPACLRHAVIVGVIGRLRRSSPRGRGGDSDSPRNSSVPSAGYSKGLVHAPQGSGPVRLRLDRRTATLVTPHTHTGGAAPTGRPIQRIEVRACGVSGPDGLPSRRVVGKPAPSRVRLPKLGVFSSPVRYTRPSAGLSSTPGSPGRSASNLGRRALPAAIHLILYVDFSGSWMPSRSHSSTAAR